MDGVAGTEWFANDYFWLEFEPGMFNDHAWQRADDEARLVADLLAVKPGERVLDLCCGPGRHLLPLAKIGLQMTGVDRTESYLERVTQKVQAEGLQAQVVLADMREYVCDNSFDGAILMSNSFGYFDDKGEDERVLANICKSLKTGKRFVIDLSGKESLARNFVSQWSFEENGIIVTVHEKILDDWGWRQMTWELTRNGQVHSYASGHRLYSAAELKEALFRAGFANVKFYGNFAGGAYDETASHMVAVAQK
ncbi:MAG: hypothetical protein A2Y07_05025 [Planctomycetes bacterium GWF2_50_10]|nr:MAG: hypothetical protein A2Y07_05025 [Planctomycetes bacterium GWF2_50_10]